MKYYDWGGMKYDEDEVSGIECKFCNTTLLEAQEIPETDNARYFREDQFGDYFCEKEECVWEHVEECDLVEITELKEEKNE